MSDQRETDTTDDPRKQGTGQGGYPESQQEETTPKEGTDEGPEAGTDDTSAPETDGGEDSGAQQATGNPKAAG
jgi:hypothetical protein